MGNQYQEIYMQNVRKFAKEFKQNSAYFINRFLNGYSKDKMRVLAKQFNMVLGDKESSIEWIDNEIKSYRKVNIEYIDMVRYFGLYMGEQEPLKEPMVVWRGCDTLEDGAVDGLVATSTKRETAEGFNYGTLLKINLPKGMRVVKYSEITQENDVENEIILPPCNYTIKSERQQNVQGRMTRIVEIDVQPKDFLREFIIRMAHPVADYINENDIDNEYKSGYLQLSMTLAIRTIINCKILQAPGTAINGGIDSGKRKNNYNVKRNSETDMYKNFSLMKSSEKLPNHMISSMKDRIFNMYSIPNQISSREFFDYIQQSKSRRIFFDYENTDEHKIFYQKHIDHGTRHVDNVTMYTYYIASKEGYNDEGIRILMEAARYHDIGRTNDWQQGGHGFAGAKKYTEHYRTEIPLHEQQLIGFLIQAHDLPKKEQIKELAMRIFSNWDENMYDILCDMTNILRDADALDRTRFPIYSGDYLKPEYLTHSSAQELIEVAQTLNYRENIPAKSQSNKKRKPIDTVGGGHGEK